MAEAVVSFVVEKLRDLLIQEAIFLYGVRDQVEWVETELRRMQCFLKDADAKRRKGDERVKNWVREVTDVAYQAEDAIDNFLLQVEPRQRRKGLVGLIWRYATIPSMLIARHKVGKEIEGIKLKIRDIAESRVTYGIANLGEIGEDQERHESLEAQRRVSPNINDDTDAIVGFDVYTKMIVSQLLDTKTKRRCVISIIGMGGLGKTTLAKKIFNSREVMTSFPIRIWITVSQDYQMCELLKSIARKAMGTSTDELEKMKEEEVKEKLHEFLKEEIYLIVMDDIWRTDVWIKINEALPEEMNGSRILITSRLVEVAKSADPSIPPLMLPLLNDDESWELFTKKVFPTSTCPEELKLLARQMVKKCRGLPLALVVLGGILSKKLATPLVWLKVSESMDWESTEDGKDCMNILALSYNNLPNHYLKSCFLYMGSFPEDSEIRASRLIKLWIAEGFIPQRGRETMEDTANGYLEELIQRSLIQVVKRRMYDGGISRCRIHDLMREVCLVEAKQDGFLNYIHSNSSNDSNVSNSRRLALQSLTDDNYSRYLTPNLRSLFARIRLDSRSGTSLHGLKLLRVLVMCDIVQSQKLPKEIGSMTHLRYLEVGHSELKKISSFIGRFRWLQTLDISPNETSCKLPKELAELLNVRHLFLPYCLQCCPTLATSTKLQTLKNVRCDQTWIEENLPTLTNLHRLSMICEGDANALSAALGKLCLLASFELTTRKLSAEDILTALAQNHHLHKLKLTGEILERRLPTSSVFPPNLAKLRLSSSKLGQDPIPVLEKLPNLMSLELSMNAYVGEKIVCTTGGFPRLQVFEVEYLGELKHWIVEVGSLPNLSSLKVLWCQSLTMLPDGLQHMSSLKELLVHDERKEFRDKLQEKVGENWYKIKHVPSLVIQGRIYGDRRRAARKRC